jgi:hypothetical protein
MKCAKLQIIYLKKMCTHVLKCNSSVQKRTKNGDFVKVLSYVFITSE